MSNQKKRCVLFVCTGNSARSQMAEGFGKFYGRGGLKIISAGLEPKGVNPFAIEVMQEKGIDISKSVFLPCNCSPPRQAGNTREVSIPPIGLPAL